MCTPETASRRRSATRPAALVAALLVAAALPWGALAEPAAPAKLAIRIGVIAARPKDQVLAGWQPLAAALERALPDQRFQIQALDYPELEAAIAAQRLDLVITNPAHYVGIRTRQPMSGVLATIIEQGPGVPLPAFGGAILARADRADLVRLSDLDGARVAAVGVASLGGYQAQAHELFRAGLPLPRPDRLRLTGMPHDQVVEQVLAGQADAGFVRAGTIEAMIAEGRLRPGLVKVLNRQDLPGFPYAVSTRLYPDWPVVALSHVDPDLARRIAAALLVMEHGGLPRSAESAFHGFAIPADYAQVEALLRDLRLPPFDAAPVFGATDVFRRYRLPISVLAASALLIAALLGVLAVTNRRLAHARRETDEFAQTLALVLATATVGVARVRERRLAWTSRHMEELFGYSAAELAGASTRLLFPDEEAFRRTGQKALSALAEGRQYVAERPMRRKDGTLFWSRLRGAPHRGPDGALDGIWTFEDVGDRRAVEEELRRALAAREATTAELREALSSVKQLSGLLPICMYCHKIRTDQGYWDGLEGYISAHSEALFSHGICPTCLESKHPGA